MENFRSKSCLDGRNNMQQMEIYNGAPSGMHDLRCYSASYANTAPQYSSSSYNNNNMNMAGTNFDKEVKIKKPKKDFESKSKSWSFNDPEFQRKRRVAGYKVYGVEGKMKGSFRKSFRWIKDRYTQVVYGWW